MLNSRLLAEQTTCREVGVVSVLPLRAWLHQSPAKQVVADSAVATCRVDAMQSIPGDDTLKYRDESVRQPSLAPFRFGMVRPCRHAGLQKVSGCGPKRRRNVLLSSSDEYIYHHCVNWTGLQCIAGKYTLDTSTR
jgi:hypothetical protein